MPSCRRWASSTITSTTVTCAPRSSAHAPVSAGPLSWGQAAKFSDSLSWGQVAKFSESPSWGQVHAAGTAVSGSALPKIACACRASIAANSSLGLGLRAAEFRPISWTLAPGPRSCIGIRHGKTSSDQVLRSDLSRHGARQPKAANLRRRRRSKTIHEDCCA